MKLLSMSRLVVRRGARQRRHGRPVTRSGRCLLFGIAGVARGDARALQAGGRRVLTGQSVVAATLASGDRDEPVGWAWQNARRPRIVHYSPPLVCPLPSSVQQREWRMGTAGRKPKRTPLSRKSDPSVSYDEFKEFEGRKYTGMKIGRSDRWYYDQGEWKEGPSLFSVDDRS
jgi:hypothetical protein